MGKKVERRTKAAAKEKRNAASASKNGHPQPNHVESGDDGVSVVKEKKPCKHLGEGICLNNFSEKIEASDPIRCQFCCGAASDRKGHKGKGKHGKKKGNASVDSKSNSKAIWVCLACGHYACGGVGLPTTPQSHAIRHAKQSSHPLVIQWENPHLRWCFLCNTLIPVEKIEDNGENKDVLSEVVKLLKNRSMDSSSADVEDVWFGSDSVSSEVKSEISVSSGIGLEGKAGYVVRGLTNLGNTCFFNSVMQNLLAIGKLRDYFLNLDASLGPLTIALKKLFAETKPETGLRNVINPRSFFGCLCSKAPQFRGYQQHDSHELLRCLLDGLCTEELGVRKRNNASEENDISSNQGPTFVDSVFGGQISSTVQCVECGHSSTVYEPFLDLSLPVPTKRPPFKKAQTARAKKSGALPKKSGKRPKRTETVKSSPNPSASSESSCLAQSSTSQNEKVASSSGYSSLVDLMGTESSSSSQNFQAIPKPENEQVLDNSMDETMASFAWLDYLEPETMSDEHDLTLQNSDILFQDSGEKDKVSDDVLMESSQIYSVDRESNVKPHSSSGNPWEEELPALVQHSEVILLPYNEESSTTAETMSREAEPSSSVVGSGQEELDFDGFGGLFNEPEVAIGPVARPSLGTDGVESGYVVGNSSESDPDEVDNSDSPVSVESCLAHFIKLELLTDDNAWDCESCQQQKLEALKKQNKLASITLINGGETGKKSDPQSSTKEISCPSEAENYSNGDIKADSELKSFDETSISCDGETDCLNQNCVEVKGGLTSEMSPVVSQGDEGKTVANDTVEEQSHSSSICKSSGRENITDQVEGSCSVDESSGSGCTTNKVQRSDSCFEAGNHFSDERKCEVINSKKIKVKRDATKRVLINKAPPLLTVHLKRFSQDARGRLSKLNGHVNFSETINLRPYMDPRRKDQEKYDYRLVGVVEHLGTMRGGHYVAYVRGAAKSRSKAEKENEVCVWYHASDANVREASLEEVLRCEAYILFYEQI